MSVIVQDSGFVADDWDREILDWDVTSQSSWEPAMGYGLDIPNTLLASQLTAYFNRVGLIVIFFPNSHDGRGFTIARQLRLLGFRGRLRARGGLIADQYAMARRSGFDEVEISDEMAARQPEDQWLARTKWQAHDYQSRLRRA
jgi:uncharacterized protein (DUF934 family)